MSNRFTQIGFSQRIRIEWMEQTAQLFVEKNDKETITSVLNAALREKLSVGGHSPRGNREKTVTILTKIWVTVPNDLVMLRNTGIELLQELPLEEHLPIHWGMSMAVYPFFAAVAAVVGRLLKLQGAAAAAQVQRRLREQYGERETVSRAVRRVLRSFLDWQVLSVGDRVGVYIPGHSRKVTRPEITDWIIEAFLHATPNGSHMLKEVLRSPCFFPFHIDQRLLGHRVARSGRIEVIHQGGLAEDVVMLSRHTRKLLDK